MTVLCNDIIRSLAFLLLIVTLCYTNQQNEDSDFLFIIEKLNGTQVNITCLAYGEFSNSAITLRAQHDFENISKNINDNDILIPFNETRTYLDLPAVLDKQWEIFPSHSVYEFVILFIGEYKWISLPRNHMPPYICVFFIKCIEITQNNSQNSWMHLQFHYNGTHLIINGHIKQWIKIEYNPFIYTRVRLFEYYRAHDYTLLQHKNKIEFEFLIKNSHWNYLQVSFFICNGCKIYIKFVTGNGERIGDTYQYHNINNDFQWKTHLLKNTNLEAKSKWFDLKITLVAYVESTSPTNERFMVLRNLLVVSGERKHYVSRIVPLPDLHQYSCEMIDPFVLISNKNVHTTKKNIVNKFRNSKICDQETCYCSIGSTGHFCEKNCDVGYWDDCKTICDCCDKLNACDYITGICLNPEGDCYKSRSVHKINVLTTTAHEITGNVLIEKRTLQKQINKIRIDNRRNEVPTTSWYLNLDEDSYGFKFTKLSPRVTYEIGAILCIDEVCFNENAVKIKVKTRCNAPLDTEYYITTTDSKILLKLNQAYIDDKSSCAKVCGINLTSPETVLNDAQMEISGLQPYTVYNVSVWCDGVKINSKSIKTDGIVPGKVLIPELINNTIFWSAPNKDSNPVSNYNVHLTRYGSMLCNTSSNSTSTYKSNRIFFSLPKLEAFSKYAILVQACNAIGCGQNITLDYTTPHTSEISHSEQPKTFDINGTHYIIEFSNCDVIKEPFVNFTIDFDCLDNWCRNSQRITEGFTLEFKENRHFYEHPIREGLLIPYTQYETNSKIYRNKQKILIGNNQIRTPEACPPAVRYLSIYSRSNNSISLRWKKPFPPHGVLKKYTFSFSYGTISSFYEKNVNDIQKCNLWDDNDYFCWTVEELQMKPSLIIIATNEFTSNCNTGIYLTNIKLEESASDPPQNVSVEWINENMNRLLIKWKHPNKSNGRIKLFKLNFIDVLKNTTVTENLRVSREELNYYFIWTKFNESSKYKLITIPMNQFEGTSASYDELIITPPPYLEVKENITYIVNGSLCSINIPFIYNVLANSSSLIMVILYGSNCRKSTEIYQNDLTKDMLMYLDKDKDNICTYQASEYHENRTVLMNFDDYFVFSSIEDLFQDGKFEIEVLLINIFEQHKRTTHYTAQLSEISLIAHKNKQIIANAFPFDITLNNYWRIAIFVTGILIVITYILVILLRSRYSKRTNHPNNTSGRTNELNFTRNTDESIEFIPISNIMKETDFGHYIYAAIESGHLYEEYNSVPVFLSNVLKIKNSSKKENENRLEWNIIRGYKCTQAYITTHNPSAETAGQFWKNIFDNKIQLIIMLNGEENYIVYWPTSKQKKIIYGKIEIHLEYESRYINYVERFFTITDEFDHYELTQLQYLSWPQYDVPKQYFSLCKFMQIFHQLHNYEKPVVIHSSIGVGRTGTLILSDYILRMVQDVASVDFLFALNHLRRERNHLVQTKEQYQLAHVLVHDYLFIQKSSLICNSAFEANLKTISNTNEIITEQFEYLQQMIEFDLCCRDGLEDEINNVVCFAANNIGNGKLFVFRIDSEQTIGKFWKNIIERNCFVLVVLEKLEITFYPTETTNRLKIDDNISIYVYNCSYFGWYTKLNIKLKLQYSQKEHFLEIVQIHDSIDKDVSKFNQLYQDLKLNYKNKNKAITCSNGYNLSGLFIAYHLVIEKLLTDQICDIISVIREIRYKNKDIICNEGQLRFFYSLILGAINKFQLYHCYDTIYDSIQRS